MITRNAPLALAMITLLCACDGNSVRETVGLTREAPDEFRVVARPPLSVPPDFNLRPPAAPGEISGAAAEEPSYQQAQSIVLGQQGVAPGTAPTAVQPVTTGTIGTMADSNFLQQAGGTMADPSIRSQLMAEEAARAPEEQSMLEKLRAPASNEPLVNAQDEAERLKNNKQAGQAPTAGETPMAKPKDTGTLGRWFGY